MSGILAYRDSLKDVPAPALIDDANVTASEAAGYPLTNAQRQPLKRTASIDWSCGATPGTFTVQMRSSTLSQGHRAAALIACQGVSDAEGITQVDAQRMNGVATVGSALSIDITNDGSRSAFSDKWPHNLVFVFPAGLTSDGIDFTFHCKANESGNVNFGRAWAGIGFVITALGPTWSPGVRDASIKRWTRNRVSTKLAGERYRVLRGSLTLLTEAETLGVSGGGEIDTTELATDMAAWLGNSQEVLVVPRSEVGHRQRVAVLGEVATEEITPVHVRGPLWRIPEIEIEEGR